jgi:AbiV family abortive infection protein
MENNLVNLRKIERMACLALKNGLRLHFDSILLFKNNCFPSAYFLSVLALEEIGKFFLIEDFWWHSKVDGRMEGQWEEKFIELIYFHRPKQNSFAYNLDGPVPTSKFTKELFNGNIELKKQKAVYVGLPRNKRKINIRGKINNPMSISKEKAGGQITSVNDKIIEFTLGVVKGVYCVETNCAEKVLSSKLFKELNKEWPIRSSRIDKKLQKLSQV